MGKESWSGKGRVSCEGKTENHWSGIYIKLAARTPVYSAIDLPSCHWQVIQDTGTELSRCLVAQARVEGWST